MEPPPHVSILGATPWSHPGGVASRTDISVFSDMSPHASMHIVKKGKLRPRHHLATTQDGCGVQPKGNHPPRVVAQGGAADVPASQKKKFENHGLDLLEMA